MPPKYENTQEQPFQCKVCQKTFTTQNKLNNHVAYNHTDKRSYKCPECPITYKRKARTTRHLKEYHGKDPEEKPARPTTCHICGKTFKNADSCANHIKMVHERSYAVACEVCGQTLVSKDVLKRHMEKVHQKSSPARYKCDLCDKKYSTRSYLRIHVTRDHLQLSQFQCDCCEKAFGSKDTLKSHVRKVHEKKYQVKCDKCDKMLSSTSNLKTHIEAVHEGLKPFQCDICENKFKSKDGLTVHKIFLHAGKDRRGEFQCDNCGKSFMTKRLLQQHFENIHLKIKNLKCEVCGRQFYYQSNLNKHKTRMYPASSGTPKLQCNICGKIVSDLKQHVEQVHSVSPVPLVCKVCNKTFTNKIAFRSHERYAHEKTKFPCKLCGKEYTLGCNLRRHIRNIHSEIKKPKVRFDCTHCGKSYTKRALEYHINHVHGNPEKLPCSFAGCRLKYATKRTLKNHIRQVHSDNPKRFKCDICHIVYKSENGLLYHKKRLHAEEVKAD